MAKRYRLTGAGRRAWESQDTGVPADYRLILWMMDVQGEVGISHNLARVYSVEMIEEWFAEMAELGLIEAVPEGESGGVAAGPDKTITLDKPHLKELARLAGTSLARTGAFVATDRLKSRAPHGKAPGDTVVLIVEDDADQRALADLRVSMAGYKVRVADSVNGFLKEVAQGVPDLLLLDVMLPDGNGFDLLAKMRCQPALAALPIIMLTAKSDPADIGRGLVLGADGYVTKPYTKNILADVIGRVLQG